ncbi:MAG: 6-bladed beta-propeller [Pseudomonadales bacterium]|nr:6-bladed beta-propeller [Pseudomonadales bacterium]
MVIRRCRILALLVLVLSQSTSVLAAENLVSIDHVMDIEGYGDSRLSLPTDVAVTKGQVAVVDSGHDRVSIFNDEGEFLFHIGHKGSSPGEFRAPVGIDSDKAGYLFVADTGNHRIQIFSDTGKFMDSFPVMEEGRAIRPIDVVVDENREVIYVTGNNNHKVMAFGPKGKLLHSWGGNGIGREEFRYPATLTLMADDRLGIVDVLNTRLQVYSRRGDFVIQIGGWGVLPGQFFRPKGVAFEDARVYVSDSYMQAIQVFADTGAFLHLLKPSDPEHAVETPTGIDVEAGRLYVSEMTANKVSVFELN